MLLLNAERERHAFDSVMVLPAGGANSEALKVRREYRRLAMELGALIQRNGLGQALVFLAAVQQRGDGARTEAAGRIVEQLTRWVTAGAQVLTVPDGQSLVATFMGTSQARARRIEQESLAYAIALKSVAEAFIDA
jgi:CRISPR/Cas system CMR-associated protein Cmr5 small subunit